MYALDTFQAEMCAFRNTLTRHGNSLVFICSLSGHCQFDTHYHLLHLP